jgi:hypothetical protein
MLVAFILTVNLSQNHMPPADAAGRFGVTAEATIRKLVLEAVRLGSIAKTELAHGKVFVARRGYNFDAIKNELAKMCQRKMCRTCRSEGFGVVDNCHRDPRAVC